MTKAIIDLFLVPLSIVGGILTILFAPLPEFVKWLLAGVLIVFIPLALAILHLRRGIRKLGRTQKGTR